MDIALGIAMSCFLGAMWFRLWKKQSSPSERSKVFWDGITLSILPIFVVLLSGMGPITYGVPMIVAKLVGQEIELPYTSEWYGGLGPDGHCPYSIELEGVPSPWDRLCNQSEELATTIKPGEAILVSGKGTSMGLFAHRAKFPNDR
ncbi:hypothetical protein [Ruegeria sp. MALMAid1280]|uniref:hypothetical protein n=1 Tax=Ruegeria sp. MALMAid1280 TaxID=3411634 RepID=UPI003BA194A0